MPLNQRYFCKKTFVINRFLGLKIIGKYFDKIKIMIYIQIKQRH